MLDKTKTCPICSNQLVKEDRTSKTLVCSNGLCQYKIGLLDVNRTVED